MNMADKTTPALLSVNHVQVIEAKNGPIFPASLIFHTIIQCTCSTVCVWLCSASLDVIHVNRDLNLIPVERGV